MPSNFSQYTNFKDYCKKTGQQKEIAILQVLDKINFLKEELRRLQHEQ